MSNWLRVLLLVGLPLATACVHRAPRSGQYVWQLRGAVVSVSDTLLQVRHKTGGIVDMQLDSRTVYTRNKHADSRQSLLQGTRVIVDVETLQRDVYRARRVQIFGGGRAK